MKNIFLFFFITVSACILSAQPFTGTYPFTNVTSSSGITDPTPPPIATGLTFGSFSAAGTPINPNAGGRFSFTNWPAGATNADDTYANLTGSTSTTEYYEVTLTPSAGYSIDLTEISFSVQRSSTGIRTYSVRSNADGYTTNLSSSINPANANLSVQPGNIFFWNSDVMTTNQNGSTVTLGGPAFSGLTTPATFRFYGWNSESSAGTCSIDNVTFTGTANALLIVADFMSTSVCEGTATSFMDMSQSFNGPIVSWAWDFSDGTVSALSNPSHTYNTCGTYNVQLIATNSNGDDDTIMNPVTVFCNPAAGIMVMSPTTGCNPLCVFFMDMSTINSGSIVSWSWDFGDGSISSLKNPSHCYAIPGNYDVSLTVTSNNGCIVMTTINNLVTVNPNPVAGFSNSTTGLCTVFTNTSSDSLTYSWNFGDGSPLDSTQNPSHCYPSYGTYTVCQYVTNVFGCPDSTCVTITFSISGMSETFLNSASFFPNPSNGILTLDLGTAFFGKAEIVVTNILGEKIISEEIIHRKSHIDLSGQPNEIYFVKIVSGKKTITKKIAINR